MSNRRKFLKYTMGACTFLFSPVNFANIVSPTERRLAFLNLHTGEKLSATYWAQGDYIPDELAAINKILRDHRNNEIAAIDSQLLDMLYVLQNHVEKVAPYHIISGYRSPQTNKLLRNKSTGVAKRSLHMQGKAVDIRLPGVELKHLQQAALSLRAGGVGYYPKSQFIHVDTGRPRFW